MTYAVAAVALTRSNISVAGPASAVFDGYRVPSGGAADLRRVLLTAQTTASENGVWIFAGAGNPMSRPSAAGDQYAMGNVLDNATLVPVTHGSTYAGTVWGLDPAKVVTVDTDSHTLGRVSLHPVQCRAGTTGDINLASTWTTIDGVSLNGNGLAGSDIVLVKNQATRSENGLYWANTGAAMARCSEPLVPGRTALVSEGDRNAHTRYELATQGAIVPATTNVNFSPQNAHYNVMDYGAVGNSKAFRDGSISSTTLTASTSTPFAAGDAGKNIDVGGAGSHGGNLITTIAVFTDVAHVTLASAAGTSVTKAPTVVWDTDDTTAITNAINAIPRRGGVLFFPSGVYVVTRNITIPARVQVHFDEGAILAPSSATVTIQGRVRCHPTQQIFGGTGVNRDVIPAGTSPPTVTVAGNPRRTIQFKIRVVSSVQLVAVTGGSGYTSAPRVTFEGPGRTGLAATGTASIASGAVTGVAVDYGGLGYVSAPSIKLSGGGSMDATATATLASTATLATMAFQYSLDNGTSWSFGILQTVAGSSYAYAIPDTGVTVIFSSGTYTLGDTYAWRSTPAIVLTPAANHEFFVKWWGAAGDGAADDTTAIQAALDATAGLGIPVRIPAGVYHISDELQTPDNATDLCGAGTPYNLGQSTVITSVAAHPIRSMIRVTGRSHLSDLVLNCNAKAQYGILRHGDSLSHYRSVDIHLALLDGFHATACKDGQVISALIQTGTGPVITVTGHPIAQYGGLSPWKLKIGVGTPPTTFDVEVPGLSTVTGLNIPAGGGDVSIPLTNNNNELGLLVHFPSGTFTANEVYQWTVTGDRTINDQSRFTDCRVDGCGTVFATSGFPTAQFTERAIRVASTPAAGTVAITAGSQTIVGSSTTFLSTTGARAGDFIRVGAYPVHQTNHRYEVGAMVTAAGQAPGQAFVWRARVGGTTGGGEPDWPLQGPIPGSMPIYQGVGATITDGGVVWECYDCLVFQILNVLDDTHITVNTQGTPLHPASGLDYAICAGSGFFEELSSDANTSVVDGGVYASCAACGLMSTADYGDKIFNGQFSANGVAGIAIGIAQHITYDTVIHAPYFEANLCAMILISAALGIDIIHPVVTGGNQQPILDLGNTSTFGTWRGSNGSSVIDQPVGVAGYTTLPVTETPTNRVFNIRGPVAVIPWQQNLLDAGGGISTNSIEPNSPLIYVVSLVAITSNAKPFLTVPPDRAGLVRLVKLVNLGGHPITLQDHNFGTKGSLLKLETPQITLLPTNTIEFYWDGVLWRQAGAIGRCLNISDAALHLVNGSNDNVVTPGLAKVEINDPMLTMAFTITGMVAGYDGQEILVLNLTSQTMTITHLDTASSIANRIGNPTGASLVLRSNGYSSVRIVYSVAKGHWIVTDYH